MKQISYSPKQAMMLCPVVSEKKEQVSPEDGKTVSWHGYKKHTHIHTFYEHTLTHMHTHFPYISVVRYS